MEVCATSHLFVLPQYLARGKGTKVASHGESRLQSRRLQLEAPEPSLPFRGPGEQFRRSASHPELDRRFQSLFPFTDRATHVGYLFLTTATSLSGFILSSRPIETGHKSSTKLLSRLLPRFLSTYLANRAPQAVSRSAHQGLERT